MRNTIQILILFIGISLHAQYENVYVEFEDKQIYRKETKAVLFANSQTAIYEEQQSEEGEERKAIQNSVANILEVKLNRFYKNKDSNIIYYKEFIKDVDSTYFIYDSLPDLNWKLIPETDTISGYVCKKAKVKFRGSNLTAYYSTEIPISFGPWKFDGLPGLILKISSDEDKEILWQATRVIYPYKKEIEFDFEKDKYTMSLKQFKIKEFGVYQDRMPKMSAQKTANLLKYGRRQFVVEKIFEWEKEGDVWRFYYVKYFKKIPPW